MSGREPEQGELDLGRAWLSRGRPDRAEEHLRRALAQSPDDVEAQALLGAVLLDGEKTDEGLELAQRAAAGAPDWYFPHLLISGAHASEGKAKLALAAAERAVALEPEEASTHGAVATAHAVAKRWEDSLAAAERGLELDPEDSDCANRRAFALVQLGRGERADFSLGSSLRRDPENPTTHAHLGWAALNAGDSEKAIRHYREALRLDPSSEFARAGLVEAMNSRNIVYRLFLKWFLFCTRVPRRTVVMIFIVSIFVRGALLRCGRGEPGPRPDPDVPLLRADRVHPDHLDRPAPVQPGLAPRPGRPPRSACPSNGYRPNWLAGCLVVAALLAAAWIAGVPAMGLATGLVGALDPARRRGRRRGRAAPASSPAGFAITLAILAAITVHGEYQLAEWHARFEPYWERLSEEARHGRRAGGRRSWLGWPDAADREAHSPPRRGVRRPATWPRCTTAPAGRSTSSCTRSWRSPGSGRM